MLDTMVVPAQPMMPGVPALWPISLAETMMEEGAALMARNLQFVQFVQEEIRLQASPAPELATPNSVRSELRTMVLRDYGVPEGMPTLVDAPYAGHTAAIADYHRGQSLIETLLAGGIRHVALTDWKSATEDMKDLDVDSYLAEMVVAIDELGGCVNLVGLCQGGWLSTMVAARFPEKVNTLVLAGAPIDMDAGEGPIRQMVHSLPMSFYEELVAVGGGLMRGSFMLQGWKNMHPEQHYFRKHLDLWEHIDDPDYIAKRETFDRWYETTVDLPGRWYLQVINELFKENRLARGEFVGLGQRLNLRDVQCPLYLLAGAADDITTPEQVLEAARLVGTPAAHIVQNIAPGGHIGLFMGARTLREQWPHVVHWINRQTPRGSHYRSRRYHAEAAVELC